MLSVGLYLVVMAISVWACVGDNIARWLLILSAVTLTAIMWILNAVFILSNMDLSGRGKTRRDWFYISRNYFVGR